MYLFIMIKHVYKQRTATTVNCELSVLNDFKQLLKEERMSLSEKFNKFMLSELDRSKRIAE